MLAKYFAIVSVCPLLLGLTLGCDIVAPQPAAREPGEVLSFRRAGDRGLFPLNNLFAATVSMDADGIYTLRGSMWVASDPAAGDCGGDSIQFNDDLCHGAVAFDDRVLSDSQSLEIERLLALFPEHVARDDVGVVDIPFTAILEFDGRIETSECLESDRDLCGEAFRSLELLLTGLALARRSGEPPDREPGGI
ncbi:MAG: hypothetical protein IID33_14590, partial [Planctomycetes bacterium]|nr:hypothetical protein [Planctomycetota bacterium]